MRRFRSYKDANAIYYILLFLAVIFILACSACASEASKEITEIGEVFEVYGNSDTGTLLCSVDSCRVSDNVTDFGLAPEELTQYDGVTWYDGETPVSLHWPDYIDTESGQLVEPLLFVLVEITVKNVDAVCDSNIDRTGDPEDSWYAFCLSEFKLCDTSIESGDAYFVREAVWYDVPDGHVPEAGVTSGDNYFILWPGETVTLQIGYVAGSGDDDFSQLCITDGGGSLFSEGAHYVYLGIEDVTA